MKRPSPYQIAAFAHCARERSFSGAAAALEVTQSSVTQHVAHLEQSVGAQLFVRRREGLELTPNGRELFLLADRWLIADQLVKERIASYSNLEGGSLRITATAVRPAMPIIMAFRDSHPDVVIDFSLCSWERNTQLLKERRVDIAIVTDPKQTSDTRLLPLRRSAYRAYMRTDTELARMSSVSLRRLMQETVILPEDGSLTQRVIRQKCDDTGITFNSQLLMTTFAVGKEAVLHGLGIGIFLDDSIYPNENLAALPIDEMPESYLDCMVVPDEKQELRTISRFRDIAMSVHGVMEADEEVRLR